MHHDADEGPSATRRRLESAPRIPGPPDLVRGALLIAAAEYPDLNIDEHAQTVRAIADESAQRAAGIENPFARLDAVTDFLYNDLGFKGNVREFNDPRNSYLNDVLTRRLGIPLTLAIILLEAARAAGFEARGVGLPGHLVARVTRGDRTIFIDPFHRGQVITEDDCRNLIKRTTGRPSLFRRGMLEGVDDESLLARMLLNLKHLYVERKDYARALGAVERLLLLRPQDPGELRDRGFLKAHLGRPAGAIEDLESYLTESPAAPDVESVRGRLVWLRRHLSELN